MKKTGKSLAMLLICLVLASVCMFAANRIQQSNGTVTISDGTTVRYKLYKPVSATETSKAPAKIGRAHV